MAFNPLIGLYSEYYQVYGLIKNGSEEQGVNRDHIYKSVANYCIGIFLYCHISEGNPSIPHCSSVYSGLQT